MIQAPRSKRLCCACQITEINIFQCYVRLSYQWIYIGMSNTNSPTAHLVEKKRRGGEIKRQAYSTEYSQAVTHPSTNSAQCCLTSVIWRELVLSTRYGRSHQCWEPMGNTSSNLNVHEQIHKSFAYMDQTRAGASGLIIPQPQCIHIRLRGAIGSASDSRSEGCVFKSRRGQPHFKTAGSTVLKIW